MKHGTKGGFKGKIACGFGVFMIFVLTAGCIGDDSAEPPATTIKSGGNPSTEAPKRVNVSVDDDPVMGSDDAPVTIIEFSDFECPFCKRFHEKTFPQLDENYVKTGRVKLVYRDMPSGTHEHAQKAAEAAECAHQQEKFWEYHNKLFENQNALDIASLKQYAVVLNLNSTAFDDCLDSGMMESEVRKDFEDGINAGVSGTPAFFVNGVLVRGAQPFEVFKKIIDSELEK